MAKKNETKNETKDDLFDEFEDFFAKGDEGAFWQDEPEVPVKPEPKAAAAQKPADKNVEPVKVATPAVAPVALPPVGPPLPAAPVTSGSDITAPLPGVPSFFSAPTVPDFGPNYIKPEPTRPVKIEAVKVAQPAAALEPIPVVPAAKPRFQDSKLFSAPTVILSIGQIPVDEDDSEPVVPVEAEPGAPSAAGLGAPGGPAAGRAEVAIFEESLFDDDPIFAADEPVTTRMPPVTEEVPAPSLDPEPPAVRVDAQWAPKGDIGKLDPSTSFESYPSLVGALEPLPEPASISTFRDDLRDLDHSSLDHGSPDHSSLDHGSPDHSSLDQSEEVIEAATADDFVDPHSEAGPVHVRDGADPAGFDVGQDGRIDTAETGESPVSALLDAPTMEEARPEVSSLDDAPGLRSNGGVALPPPVAPPAESSAAPAPRERYTPSRDSAERWLEVAISLEHEADIASFSERHAALLAAAGRVYFERLGRWEESERLFAAAVEGGADLPTVLQEYGDVVASLGDYRRLRDLLVRRADRTEGVVAAEALNDAALVERNTLKQDSAAVELLERSLRVSPDDWFALRLLRELHFRSRSWEALAQVLGRMAELASGPRASRLLVERGRLLEVELGRPDDAHACYLTARAADPAFAPAFLALERLARARGDHASLVQLYQEEAARVGGPDGAFWLARGARVAAFSGQAPDEVAALWAVAVEAAGPEARELRAEHQNWLAVNGRVAELALALAQELDHATGAPAVVVGWRLARLQEEVLRDPAAALETWRRVVALDASVGPAVEAVSRIYGASGRFAELVAFYAELLPALTDPNLVVTTLYRMGELCEGPLADQEGARGWFERILDTAPGYLPALEGLERVYMRLGAWPQVAAVYEQRAILTEDPSGTALQLHRAGSVYDLRLHDVERAADFYLRALEHQADFQPSLDALARILEGKGDWAGLAGILRRAAEVSRDANEVVSYTYRSARILVDKVGDNFQAMALLRRCLELSPGFLPALALTRELAIRMGSWSEVVELHRLEADAAEEPARRHWRLLAAAETAERVAELDSTALAESILAEAPEHVGAQSFLMQRLLRRGDRHQIIEVYRQRLGAEAEDATRARVAARVADLAGDLADGVATVHAISEVVGADAPNRPLGALARVAESLNYWEDARRALEAAQGPDLKGEVARLIETYVEDPAVALTAWRAALDASPRDNIAAAGLERALGRSGSREGLAEVHAVLAAEVPDAAIRVVHALLAGHLFEAAEDREQAELHYQLAQAGRPGAGKAFEGLRRLAMQEPSAEKLALLFGSVTGLDPLLVASSYEEAGLAARAAEVYRGCLETETDEASRLVLVSRLEANLVELNDWHGVFTLLGERLQLTHHAEERKKIEAKRRWVLAEKLAETDEAWDFYRQLHDENPKDVEVLEALSRIAAARGDTQLAIQYLDGLSAAVASPVDRARFQRRVAEAWERVGDAEAARQAYLRALDLLPEDMEALAGLRTLASAANDWQALVGVLTREAAVVAHSEQVVRYREIARIWEENLQDPAVATDAWRKVLDLVADDPTALRRLVVLGRSHADWDVFAEHAVRLLPLLPLDERRSLESELGAVYLNELNREEEALRFLDAAIRHRRPDLYAAQLLERIHAARGAWDQVVEALIRQADASEGEAAVALLLRAAQVRMETLHDRDGAAALFASVLELDPDNGEALRFRGDFLFQAGDLAGAADIFARMEPSEKARDLDDFDVKIEVALYYFRFAEVLVQLGRKEDAVQRFGQALELNPNHLPSLEAVGPLYMATEQWDRAAQVFRQMLQLTGGQGDSERLARTYTNLGTVELNLGNLDKARQRFTKALELRQNDVRALQGVAAVMFARNDWNNLLNVYNNIIYHAQEPTEVVDAYLTKGYVLDAKMNLADKAAQHYEKSLAFDPAQPVALLRLAELHLRKADWPEAATLVDRGLALAVGDRGYLAGLHLVKAIAWKACNDEVSGARAFRAALAADPTLADSLGTVETPAVAQMMATLKERLQARL